MVSRASPARTAAFEILQAVGRERGEPAALLHAPERDELSPADRDLMTELTYGVLRWRARIDHAIAHFAKRPIKKIDDVPLTALRLGMYQLEFLTGIPARAAVDESVRLTHAFRASFSASFVNAVLRSAARNPAAPPLPTRGDDPVAYLSVTLSHPEWLVRRYLERLGLDGAEARCRAQNERPPLHIRVSHRLPLDEARASLDADGVATDLVRDAPRALAVRDGAFRESALYRDGLANVQDAGSQRIASLVDADASDVVLDVCAAPGGKSAAVADAHPASRVVALDRRHRRTKLTRALIEQLRLPNVSCVTADGLALPIGRRFRRILLDAPCSSLGTLRRNPDVKWRAAAGALKEHARVQRALLSAAASHLAPGGRLVYATCSSEPEENEHVVQAILATHPTLSLVRVESRADGFFETTPERDGTDAYFGAILTRAASGSADN